MHESPGSLVGRQVDQFRLDQFLGGGADGMVFKAFDTVLLRTVAVKLISRSDVVGTTEEDSGTHQEARKRLILQAKAAGRLNHPHMVTIHCYGETADFVYLCMEYVTGRTLTQILDEQKMLTVAEALVVFDQILQAMELAGQEAIVHRNIKPSSIVIGDNYQVKVMDFGIPRLPLPALNTDDSVLGTPHYTSPEQISGQAGDIRSDLFSVGAVLYEALTGERPFTAESTTALICKILQVEPIPPRVLNIYIPESLDDIMKKALAKNPADRFQTPAEMLMALRAVSQTLRELAEGRNGSTIVNEALPPEEDLSARPEDRGRAGAQAPPPPVAAASRPRSPCKDVPRLRSMTGAAAGQTEPNKAALKNRAIGLPASVETVSGEETKSVKTWHVVRILSALAVLLVLIVAAGIVLWHLLATPDEQTSSLIGTPVGSIAGNGQSKLADSTLRSSVESLLDQARVLWESNPGAAQRLLEQAAALDPNHFDATFQLARFLTFKKDFTAAILQYQNALRLNDQVPDVFFNLGYIYLSQGALDQAIENYEACQALSPPYLDEVLTNLAVCHWRKNNPVQARVLLKQALDFNPNNELARNYMNLLEKSVGPKK